MMTQLQNIEYLYILENITQGDVLLKLYSDEAIRHNSLTVHSWPLIPA